MKSPTTAETGLTEAWVRFFADIFVQCDSSILRTNRSATNPPTHPPQTPKTLVVISQR